MLEILKITDEMADDIGRIGFLSWNSAYKNIIPDDFLKEYTADKRAAAMRNSLLSRSEDFYMFKYNEAPAGFAIIGTSQDSGTNDSTGEIHAIYFDPDYWGLGCAGEAMAFCLNRLKELGYSRIVLWVLEENLRAIKFYEKHGFSNTGLKREITIGKPLNEVCFSLVLG